MSATYAELATAADASADDLRERLREDSYVLLRGVLDPARVLALRARVVEVLTTIGWLRPGPDPSEPLPGDTIHHDHGRRDGAPIVDPGWAEGYRAVQELEEFHALAHDEAIVRVVGGILGSDPIVHPRKIARITFPGSNFPTPPHQDAIFNGSAVDVLTVWVPFGDVAQNMGGLRVLRGSASDGFRPPTPSDGLGGEAIDVPLDDPRWLDVDYAPGDAVIFHGLSIHMTQPNRSARVRLSGDYRYQSRNEPFKPAALLPHGFGRVLPGWTELSYGWSSIEWIDVPGPVLVTNNPRRTLARSALLGGV